MAKRRIYVVACLRDPQRAVRIFADILSPRLSFQLEMRSDHPTFQVNDFMLPQYPEPTCAVAINAQDVAESFYRQRLESREETAHRQTCT